MLPEKPLLNPIRYGPAFFSLAPDTVSPSGTIFALLITSSANAGMARANAANPIAVTPSLMASLRE